MRDALPGVEAYTLLSDMPAGHVRVRFPGLFEGTKVLWEADLWTLEAYYRQHPERGVASDEGLEGRQFLQVEAPSCGFTRLTVALNVAVIDMPTVQKAIIMIRQYKRLSVGRHEYGELVRIEAM